jgi:hypothetical protein
MTRQELSKYDFDRIAIALEAHISTLKQGRERAEFIVLYNKFDDAFTGCLEMEEED